MPEQIIYANFRALITGEGFALKQGRRLKLSDAGIIQGPVHIRTAHGKIVSIEKTLPAGEQVDCSGLVATAGFSDSHTHALFGGARWQEFYSRWAGKSYVEINEAGGGIRKTFRDTASLSDTELGDRLQQRIQFMRSVGTRALEIKSGYGATLTEELRLLRLLKSVSNQTTVPTRRTFLGLHALPEQMKESSWVDEAIATLAVIKQEQLADFVDAFPEQGFFSLAESERFLIAAKKLGFEIKIHADEITSMGATELGLRIAAVSVDHLQKISSEALALVGQSSTICTLLPATSFYMGIEYAPARKILDSCGRVAFATDFNPGTAPNASLLFTAALAASQMRATPTEIFCGLTYNAAAAMKLDNSVGLIQPGYSADLLGWKCETNDFLEEITLAGQPPRALN